MSWWCSATGTAWTWQWTAYPGVWLFVAALVLGWWRGADRFAAGEPAEARRWRRAAFALGALLLWAILDWPVGALGAGYLVSVHTAQWLVISLIVPPLLWLGVPAAAGERWARLPGWGVARVLTRPAVAFVLFNTVLIVSHVPAVVDALKASPGGSFVLDAGWLGAGLVMWAPVAGPPAAVRRLSPPAAMGYLFLNNLPAIVPFAFLTFSDNPIYRVFELAPRIGGVPAMWDQTLAGLLMKPTGDMLVIIAIAIVFFRWQREEGTA